MPMDLAKLSDTDSVTLDYGEAGSLTVVYRPGAITERSLRELRVLGDMENNDFDANFDALNGALLRAVVSWDMLRGGVPVPLTADGLADVDILIRVAVLRAVVQGLRLDPKSATAGRPASRVSSGRGRRATSTRRG